MYMPRMFVLRFALNQPEPCMIQKCLWRLSWKNPKSLGSAIALKEITKEEFLTVEMVAVG